MVHRRRRTAMTLIEVIVVVAIIGVLFSLALPAIQRVRENAGRVECANNLRQIGMALHNYHDTLGAFPPGHIKDTAKLYPRTGWQLHLLPFLEQLPLWQTAEAAFKQDSNAYDNPPHTGMETPLRLFACPVDSRVSVTQFTRGGTQPVALTSYLGVIGADLESRDGVLFSDSRIRLTDITDGTSNTLLVGERPPSPDFNWGWWYAGNGQKHTGSGDMILGVREINYEIFDWNLGEFCPPGPYHFVRGSLKNQCDLLHFWSLHSSGANFLSADGSVHFLPYSTDQIMPSLASRSGHEAVSLP